MPYRHIAQYRCNYLWTAAAAFGLLGAAEPVSVRTAVPTAVVGTAAAPDPVAVVVNPKTPVDNLSMGELRTILLGDKQFWSPGNRITLLIRAPVSHARDLVLKRAYDMTEAQFRQYWIAKVFRAEIPSGPKVVNSDDAATALVAGLPGAIAFVDASDVARGVKVLRIDGRRPGDRGYALN